VGITKEQICDLEVRIPKNKKIIRKLDTLFKEIDAIKNNISKYELLYKKCMSDLKEEALNIE
jgi:hypothetical protein